MGSTSGYEDPLGFSKQTAVMLVGLGAGDLVPEFRKRNISTQELSELNKADLIVLGADEALADDILRQLRMAARKNGGRHLSEEMRKTELIKILIGSNQQLNLIETFMMYAYLRLSKESSDFTIDSRKNVRASQALCVATTYVLNEITEIQASLATLQSEMLDNDEKRGNKTKLMYKLMVGLGLTTGIFCTLRFVLVAARRT